MNIKLIIIIISLSYTLTYLVGCKKVTYATNGETIFKTGKNKSGKVLQNIDKSSMKMAHSCSSCHGNDGSGGSMMENTPSIKYNDLTNPALHNIPYTEELIKRFLDHELKSDSTVANTGVVFEMDETDKNDLITFLKTL
ncbi:MAG: hypothetical protein JNM95_12175 [Chitinophagaceae bacterium]|nr:hypothetical protein [Chitinophagaceae bacterium]